MSKIKTLSCNTLEFKTKELVESFKDTGFAIITDHNIQAEALKVFYEEWAAFFASPQKTNYTFTKDNQNGFYPMMSEKAKDAKIGDLKEFFHYRRQFEDPTGGITAFVQTKLDRLSHFVLNQIQKGLPEEVRDGLSEPLSSMTNGSTKNLFRILHYPSMPVGYPEDAVRAAAHEDINLITLLPAATKTGLEVLMNDGSWHSVECDPNAIIVNIGDMLQEATNGYLKSTTHRVVNVGMNESRYSAPYFLHARDNVKLSDRYTAEEYLTERLKQLGLI